MQSQLNIPITEFKRKLQIVRDYIKDFQPRTKKTKQGYTVLFEKNNTVLFYMLKQIHFFDFHVSNNGWIIGMHQLVAYLNYGWKAFLNGFTAVKGEVEVHHLDSNPTNNSPDNLRYVSPQDNLLAAEATRMNYFGEVVSSNPTPFDNQGKPIKESKHWLVNLVRETMEKTYAAINAKLPHHLTVGRLLLELPKNIYKQVVKQWWLPLDEAMESQERIATSEELSSMSIDEIFDYMGW